MARKTYQGEKNNKSRTMNKLVQAIGLVLEEKGYTGLTTVNIARAAGVDRKLISNYFGSVDKLVETYIKGKNYWEEVTDRAIKSLKDIPKTGSRICLENLLLNQLDRFNSDEEMQKVVLWQISENSKIMSHVTQTREKISSLFFPIADQELDQEKVDLRAISSLLVAGTYYLTLHTKTTNSSFCEIDLTTVDGMNRIKKTIKSILKQTYQSNSSRKSKPKLHTIL